MSVATGMRKSIREMFPTNRLKRRLCAAIYAGGHAYAFLFNRWIVKIIDIYLSYCAIENRRIGTLAVDGVYLECVQPSPVVDDFKGVNRRWIVKYE